MEAGGRSLHAKEKSLLSEIVQRVNDLFEGDLTDDDKLIYVNNVIKGKMLESAKLRPQAANDTKEQFANLPDLNQALREAISDALAAQTAIEHPGAGVGDRPQRDQGHSAGPGETL